jgi:polyketide synthase PksN
LPLRAGISSFGFGGVNAHVVVEEYEGGPIHEVKKEAAGRQGPAMVVLSAKDGERLKEQATQLRQAIARQGLQDKDLAALAYTLQVGRVAMEQRVGMLVGSMKQLETKLEEFAEGKSGIEGLYRGEVKRNSETLAVFSGDEELREAVSQWIARGKWSKLLELWVKGVEVDWSRVHGEAKPQRMSLPTYPFAKERYWIDTSAGNSTAANGKSHAGTATAVLHPLLHSNTSDLSEQRYCSTFTGKEFFLADHQVALNGHRSQKVLPGVAYLEMARAAIEQAAPVQRESGILELKNTVWLKPIVVAEQRKISTAVFTKDDDQFGYEIYSQDAEKKTIHCQGQAVFSRYTAPVSLDIEQLKSQMENGRLEPSGIYARFAGMGLNYGPGHQGITEIYVGERQLLAQLRLPAVVELNHHEYVLHPSLMDSALQASIGLAVDHVPSEPSVPFVLESLRIISACTKEMFAWVRYSNGSKPQDKAIKLDIELCDPQGRVCVLMHGFISRVLESTAKTAMPETSSTNGHATNQHSSNGYSNGHANNGHSSNGHSITHSSNGHSSNGHSTNGHAGNGHSSNGHAEDSFAFDSAFYQKLIDDILNRDVSVDDAVALE